MPDTKHVRAPGVYGKRVIGEDQREIEATIVRTSANKYGPRVVGDGKPVKAEHTVVVTENPQTAASPPGERQPHSNPPVQQGRDAKLDENKPPITTKGEGNVVRQAAGADAYLSTRELAAALDENPASLDRFIRAEFRREGGIRKTAIRTFLKVEGERRGGPRPDVVQQLEGAVK